MKVSKKKASLRFEPLRCLILCQCYSRKSSPDSWLPFTTSERLEQRTRDQSHDGNVCPNCGCEADQDDLIALCSVWGRKPAETMRAIDIRPGQVSEIYGELTGISVSCDIDEGIRRRYKRDKKWW